MTLVEFLRARLDEDEAAALEATEGPWMADGPWWYDPPGDTQPRAGSLVTAKGSRMAVVIPPTQIGDPLQFDDDVRHIARHDPERVLAEVEAKRRIVEDRGWIEHGPPYGLSIFGERILGLLAVPYADHPDYDPRWKPAQRITLPNEPGIF